MVGVTDGDTLKVLRDGAEVPIRLSSIDAPEKAQAFGQKSKESLSELCFGKMATLTDTGKKHRDREIATVHCDGVDANTEQVRRGMAWVYRKYAPKELPLYAVEEEAKAAKRGLWANENPVPPWEWRRK